MRFRIHTIESTLFDGEIKAVNLATEGGEITVLGNHLPLVSLVKPGPVKIRAHEGQEHIIQLASPGFLEVEPESRGVTLLATEKL